MTQLETGRLIVRNFHADDWRDLHEMILQYQASEYAQYDHQWPTGMDEIKGITEWFAEGDSYLAVSLKTTGKLIGFIALNSHKEQDDVEFGLGYVFNADYHRRGYATEGCRAVLDYAFDQLGADRVSTGTAAANHPSCQLLRRLGLRETGRGTSSFRETQDGKPIEFISLSFAISRDEWLAHRQASDHDSMPSGPRKM